MDFGTIKQRLNSFHYRSFTEFTEDVSLVFENCFRFNGEDSSVGKMCKTVKDEYKRIYDQLGMDFYLL